MRKELILGLFLLILIVPIVSSAMDPVPAFCEHQGYIYEYDEELDNYFCIFAEDEDCYAIEFYEGTCGQTSIKEIPCREEGEVVFPQFEECCEGLAPNGNQPFWKKVIGQPICKPIKQTHTYYYGFILIALVIFILLIIWLIKILRKRK